MGLGDFLGKLGYKKDEQKSTCDDFRTVYDDSDSGEVIDQRSTAFYDFESQITNQVRSYLTGSEVSTDYSIIEQNGIRGIALTNLENVSIELLKAYLYRLKEKHLQVGYVKKLAVHSCKNGKENYTYYLKPSLRLQNTIPAEQIYGNITLDLEVVDNRPKQLKCTATYYSDANYKPARTSDEWFSVIYLEEEFNL